MTTARYTLPVPSTSLIQDARFQKELGRCCTLRYSYELEDELVGEELRFEGVEAVRITYYTACSIEMLEAYDKVLEVKDSQWANEVRTNLKRHGTLKDGLIHLRIYFDDGPCYEFICNMLTVNNQSTR